MARDSAYPYRLDGACNTCFDDDGHMMMMLCLVYAPFDARYFAVFPPHFHHEAT